jgi:hypothetical protein
VPEDLKRAMPCAECAAFISAYKMATERYATLGYSLHKMASNGHFKDSEYRKLKERVWEARAACEMAKTALRVHREGHKIPGLRLKT